MSESSSTVFESFAETAKRFPERPFLDVLTETADIYGIDAGPITYSSMLARVMALKSEYDQQGYGTGHRVGLLLENRPAYIAHWFALNGLGVSVVPINQDLRSDELEYLFCHSEIILCVTIPERLEQLQATATDCSTNTPIICSEDQVPAALTPAQDLQPHDNSEAALLYTSGTTGLPKGCVLANSYFHSCGAAYTSLGGLAKLHYDGEKMLTPLPLFHMNAMACSLMAMVATGGCLIMLDRFHPSTWWGNVAKSRATVIHYLGVMPAMLMGAAPSDKDRDHNVRFGFGAGVETGLHATFEARFGFPLIEAWAMTETGMAVAVIATDEPRHVGSNCFGKPGQNVEYRIEDETGAETDQGEFLVRHVGDTPRRGFFERYLKDDQVTKKPGAEAGSTREMWFEGIWMEP